MQRRHITSMEIEAIGRAIKNAGGQSALAKMIGIKQTSVRSWLKHGIPSYRVALVSKFTQISKQTLRPDLYGGLDG